MKIVKPVRLPTGLRRKLYRIPIRAYNLHLGWIFGRRLLLLNHSGRRTGKQRQSVLEIVERDPADGSFTVASGWGASADWYRNVLHTPQVSVQVGPRTMAMTARPLSEDEGGEVFARYASHHQWAAKRLLPRVLGLSVDGSRADFRAVGRHLPFIRFVPRT
jgi:deazaflavin-dependent oxidoreductase (nitroreductase family)